MSTSGKAVLRRSEMDPDDADLYEAGQLLPHSVTARVHLLTREHKLLEDLSGYFVDGQTDLQDAPVARTATATFTDPHAEINDGQGFRRAHMIQAWSLVEVTTLPYVVLEPVFCGPLTGKSDEGHTVSVTAEDKAMLSLTDVPSDHWEPKTRVVEVLREILESTGETRIAFGRGITDLIRDRVEIGAEEEIYPWTVALNVAAAAGLQLYYDAEGWARLREQPERPSAVYRAGVPGANVVDGPPSVSEEWAGRPNRALLRGGKGLVVTATLPPRNDHSPAALGRGGVPWRVTEIVENDKVTERARGVTVTERTLKRASGDFVDVAFDAIPRRDVEVLDVQRLATDRGAYNFVLDEASIPWLGGAMTVGHQRRVSKVPNRIRTKVVRRKKKKDQNGKRKGKGKGGRQ